MSDNKEKLKGGLADGMSSKDFNQKALERGIKMEMRHHTNDRDTAREIVMDNLVEDPHYYDEDKTEKKEKQRVDMEADGKRELDYGKEELNKDPKKKKKDDTYYPVNIDEKGSSRRPNQPEAGGLSKKWDKIKKALDNESAFLDMYEASGLAEEEQQEQQQQEEATTQEQEGETPPDGGVESQDLEAGEADEEEVQDDAEEQEEAVEESGGQETMEDQPEENADDPESLLSEEEAHAMLAEELEQAGFSEAEIGHILHGHGVPVPDPVDQSKVKLNEQKAEHGQDMHQHELGHKQKASELELDHKKKLQEAEYENKKKQYDLTDLENNHKRRMLDLEYEQAKEDSNINDMDRVHKKRMLDLEYEYEKKQKELELEMKRKELEMKMKHKNEIANEKHKQKLADTKDQQQDASTTSDKEKKGTMKKSVDDEDMESLEKNTKLWSHDRKTGQLNHPEHGSIRFAPHKEGIEIRHNGKSVGIHENKVDALNAAKDYMIGLSKPVKVKG